MILSSVAMIGARCGRPSPVETRAVGEDYVHSVYPFLGVDWGGQHLCGLRRTLWNGKTRARHGEL